MATKEYVSWQMVDDFADKVVDSYKDSSLTGVYGLPRGGLVLAVMISHRLGIPMLNSPCKNCLIIDDICDSGESLLHFVQNSSAFGNDKPLYHIATMYYKENYLGVVPEIYAYNKEDKWIVFPWEKKDE